MSKKYSSEEVQQILREATKIQNERDISPEQLLEIAREVGISAENLQQAERAWLEGQTERDKQAKRKSQFKSHLITYLAVSVFLVLLNLTTTTRHFWSIYPILGWGLGVAIDGASIYAKDKNHII